MTHLYNVVIKIFLRLYYGDLPKSLTGEKRQYSTYDLNLILNKRKIYNTEIRIK